MPKPPTDPSTGVQYRPETEEDRQALDATLGRLEETVAPDNLHTLISRRRWEAWRELINMRGNAFAVGGFAGIPLFDPPASAGGVLIMAWDFLSRPLTRAEVANLVAWLLMLSEVTAAELEPIFAAQGLTLRAALGLDGVPPEVWRKTLGLEP